MDKLWSYVALGTAICCTVRACCAMPPLDAPLPLLPLPPPPAARAASSHEDKSPALAVPDQQKDADFQRLAEDLMHALLSDIVADADVSAALAQLRVQPTHK